VVIAMISGSIRAALVEADQSDVLRAAELMREAADGVIEHLRLALAISRWTESAGGARRGHG
jgi:hypothetical protein